MLSAKKWNELHPCSLTLDQKAEINKWSLENHDSIYFVTAMAPMDVQNKSGYLLEHLFDGTKYEGMKFYPKFKPIGLYGTNPNWSN